MNDELYGLFLTWTCYGTWLPGDDRGHLSPVLMANGRYSGRMGHPGPPCPADDKRTRLRARQLQKHDAVQLTADAAFAAAKGLCEAGAKRRWRIARGAFMSNHVHVVVLDCPADGPNVRRILKGNATASLDTHLGSPRRWWTAGGRDRYLRGEDALTAVLRYVDEQECVLVTIIDNVPALVAQK